MTDEKTFIPSVKNILKDHIFDIPAIFILGNGFYILSEISWSFLIFNVYLLGIALIFPLLSILKFYITGSKTITIKNDGMIIHISDSQKVNYKWTDFDQIWLSDSGWIFEKSDRRKVKILKTGFDTKDWHKMANMIYEYKNATFEEKELNRTKPEFILFKPIYQKPLLISFIIMPVAGVFIVINILTTQKDDAILFLVGLFLVSILFVVPFILYKSIEFGDIIVLRRYFNVPKILIYSDIEDVGMTSIKTRKGNISLQSMKNSDLLIQILNSKIQAGKILENQLEGDLVSKELNSYKAALISLPISISVDLTIRYLHLFPITIDGKLQYFLTWLLCFTVIYFYLRKRENENINEISKNM